MKEISFSTADDAAGFQAARTRMSSVWTNLSSSWRRRFSSSTFREKGRRETLPTPDFSMASRRKYSYESLPTRSVERVENEFLEAAHMRAKSPLRMLGGRYVGCAECADAAQIDCQYYNIYFRRDGNYCNSGLREIASGDSEG